MKEYPENIVQHNLREGLLIVAIDRCDMNKSCEELKPDYRLSIGRRYVIQYDPTKEEVYQHYILDDIGAEHYFDGTWDNYFKLPDSTTELTHAESKSFSHNNIDLMKRKDELLEKCETVPVDTSVFVKNDTAKVRLELLEPEFITGIGKIITFGADKYSSYGIIPEDKLIGKVVSSCYANTVIKVEKSTLKNMENVEVVTINDLNWQTQNTQQNNELTPENGTAKIKNELNSTKMRERLTQSSENETRTTSGLNDWKSMGLHNVTMTIWLNKDVPYVNEQMEHLTLTTAIKQDSLEGYFVVGATTESECLEMTYRALQELSLISKPLKEELLCQGARNWQKADNEEGHDRIKGAILRHLMAYLAGERLDPETNESHLYHIGCNLMFLDHFDRKSDES